MFENFPSETFSFLICQSIAFWHLRKFKHIFFSLKPTVLPSLNSAYDSALPEVHFLVVVTVLAIPFLQQGQRLEGGVLLTAPVVPEMWPMVGRGHPKGISSCEVMSTILVDVWSWSIAPAASICQLVRSGLDLQLKPSQIPSFPGKKEYFVHMFALNPSFCRNLSE